MLAFEIAGLDAGIPNRSWRCVLPAGALADIVDRTKLVRITHVWLAASAVSLAILGWLHLLNGNLILLFVFLIGAGFAFNAPAFASLLTDIVSDEELPSASVLSGLQLDICGMIGPALGGALIPLIGTNTIFAANGACFLLINLALMRWQQPKGQLHSAMEDFFQSFATAVHYVRYAPGMQVILARQILFSLLIECTLKVAASECVVAALNQRGIRWGHCCFCHLDLLRVSLSTILAKGSKFQHRWETRKKKIFRALQRPCCTLRQQRCAVVTMASDARAFVSMDEALGMELVD